MREHTRTHTHKHTHNTLSLRSPMTETLTRALRRSGDISTSTTEIICCRPDGIFCLPWISPVRISVASSACTTCPTRLGRRRVSKLPIMRGNVARQIGAGARAAPIKPAWHTSESSSKRVITPVLPRTVPHTCSSAISPAAKPTVTCDHLGGLRAAHPVGEGG